MWATRIAIWFPHDVYRHAASRRVYRVLHKNALREYDLAQVVVYQGENGQVWVRPVQEFLARFVPLPHAGFGDEPGW